MNGKQNKTLTQNCCNYSWYPRKKKKRDMQGPSFIGGKKTRVWQKKKKHFVKVSVLPWTYFNENNIINSW